MSMLRARGGGGRKQLLAVGYWASACAAGWGRIFHEWTDYKGEGFWDASDTPRKN